MAFLTASVVIANSGGAASNDSGAFDSGATGADRLLVVAVTYESGGDPGISGITYNGVALTKEVEETVAPADSFSETLEVWYLANPATGSNTLQLTNSATSQDFAVAAAVYTGRHQSTPILSANTVTIARDLSNDGTLSMTKPDSDDEIFWTLTQDRNTDTVWTPVADNTARASQGLGGSTNGLNTVIGDMLTGSGSVTAGANQTGSKAEGPHDLVGIGVVMQAADTAQTIPVGQATETDTAQPLTIPAPPVADITHVGSEKVGESTGTTATVNLPAGALSGDLALVVVTADAGSTTITLPSGFTQVHNGLVPNSNFGDTNIAIGYKVLGGSEPSSYSATLSASQEYTISCHVWRGVNDETSLDVAFAFNTTDGTPVGSTLPDCPSVTTVTDGAALITVVSDSRGPLFENMDWENYYQPPAGVTELADANTNAGTGYTGHALGWELIETAGATGTRTWTSIDNDDGGFAGSLALRPAETVTEIVVGLASEGGAAQPVTVRQNTRVRTATETDAAAPLRAPRSIDVNPAQETSIGRNVGVDQTGAGETNWTDFTEYSVAQSLFSADWTLEEGGTAILTVQSDSSLPWGRRARFDLTDAGSHSTAVWNDTSPAEDWDVLLLMRRFEVDTHVVCGAARWTAGDEGYVGGLRNNATDVTIRRQQPSGTSTVLDAPHSGVDPLQYLWARFRVRGTQVQLRVWQADLAKQDAGRVDEPPGWDIDETDAVISGSGLSGIHFRHVGTANRVMDVGWFSYGTGTRIAPAPFAERVLVVGTATETSAAKVAEDKLASRIDAATELDAAQPVLALRTVSVDKVSGTVAATGVTFQLNLVVHTATETSTATGILAPRTLAVGLATETTTAPVALAVPATAVGKAFETSAAPALGTGSKVRTVGVATESGVTFGVSFVQTFPEQINRARDTSEAFPVTGAKVSTVGQAVETNTAVAAAAVAVTIINVGLAGETSAAFSVAHDKIQFVGVASEVPQALRLNSGMPPFWWQFYDQADGKPAKRRLRPLVFTDDVDGQYYIIMRNANDNLLRLEAFEPKPYDEVYSENGGPTIESDGRLYRLYVSGGVLRFERSLFDVRTRPVLFGKVARPRAQEPRYELVMLTPEP